MLPRQVFEGNLFEHCLHVFYMFYVFGNATESEEKREQRYVIRHRVLRGWSVTDTITEMWSVSGDQDVKCVWWSMSWVRQPFVNGIKRLVKGETRQNSSHTPSNWEWLKQRSVWILLQSCLRTTRTFNSSIVSQSEHFTNNNHLNCEGVGYA